MNRRRIPLALLYSMLPRHFKYVAGQSSLSPTDLAKATALIKSNNGAKIDFENENDVVITWPGELGVDRISMSLFMSAQGQTRKTLSDRVKGAHPIALLPLVPSRFTIHDLNISNALFKLNQDGIIIITKMESASLIEEESETVLSLATLLSGGIGAQKTIYGTHFVVAATKAAPINVAYTTSKLCLHQDLPYYEAPPGLQLLHCVRNDVKIIGGESLFIDGIDCAERFSKLYPKHFHILKSIHTCFEKINSDRAPLLPVHMRYFRPIIQTVRNTIVAINWSPPFENPALSLCERSKLSAFMDARNAFSEFLEEEDITKSPSKLTMRLQPGEIVVFNNRRMLHGRNEFKVEGEDAMRKLIGCYVTSDDWKSALSLSLVGQDKVYRIGNGDQL